MDATRFGVSVVLSLLIAVRGYSKKSLDKTGAVAGLITGFVTCFCGYRLGVTLIMFFISSSFLTKYNSVKKEKLEDHFKEGGQRNWIQVICNSGPATLASVAYFFLRREEIFLDYKNFFWETFCLAFILGFYACCNGDTWASEIGITSSSQPFLITTLKRVPTGTNGGISLLGTSASVAGGAFIGLVFWISSVVFAEAGAADVVVPPQWPIIVLGLLGGSLGSLIDSYLGATLQYSGYSPVLKKIINKPNPTLKRISGQDILDNHQVNLLSAALTGLFIAGTARAIF